MAGGELGEELEREEVSVGKPQIVKSLAFDKEIQFYSKCFESHVRA